MKIACRQLTLPQLHIGNCSVWLSIINTVHTSFLYSAYRALGSIFQQQRAAKINRLSEYNRLTALSICPLGGILSHLKHPWQCLIIQPLVHFDVILCVTQKCLGCQKLSGVYILILLGIQLLTVTVVLLFTDSVILILAISQSKIGFSNISQLSLVQVLQVTTTISDLLISAYIQNG